MEKFQFSHNNEWTDGIKFKTLVTEFEGGKEQRRTKGLPRRFFRLNFEKSTMTSDHANYIYNFFVARKGKTETFLWDYEKDDGTIEEVTVRFDQDELERTVFMNYIYRFGLKMIEVL